MAHPHIRFIQLDQNEYRIPQSVLAELGLSLQRTGRTPQLERAMTVLRTLFTLPPDAVEELFMAAGQVEFMSSASEAGQREMPDEYEITQGVNLVFDSAPAVC